MATANGKGGKIIRAVGPSLITNASSKSVTPRSDNRAVSTVSSLNDKSLSFPDIASAYINSKNKYNI
jgi:hypothetical protein